MGVKTQRTSAWRRFLRALVALVARWVPVGFVSKEKKTLADEEGL